MVREEHSVPCLCGHGGLWVEGRKEGLGEKAAQCFPCICSSLFGISFIWDDL